MLIKIFSVFSIFVIIGDCFAEPPYLITDSGYSAITEFTLTKTGKLYWLDNDRILFNGFAADSPENKRKRPQRIDQLALYIWDTKENKVTHYTDGELSCYHRGRVAYRVRNPDRRVFFKVGNFGEEQVDHSEQFSSRFSICNFEIARDEPEKKRFAIIRLYDGDGYLEVGKMFAPSIARDNYIKFYPATDLKGMTLPIRSGEVWPNYIDYYDFANAYILYSLAARGYKHDVSRWPKGLPQPVYLMTPEGEVSKIEIPFFNWNRGGPKDVVPTKNGIFATYTYPGWTSGVPDPGIKINMSLMGGYLVQGKKYQKIISGWIYAKGLSPDGCKLAVGISSPKFPESPSRLMMIDLCTNKTESKS